MANGRTDSSGRALALRDVDLDRFFEPSSIAVIGASDRDGSASALNYRMVRDWVRPRGITVWPVNPNRDEVDGDRCYPSMTDVPAPVDVAIVLVGAAEQALKEAIEAKAAFAVVFTAGFAETGERGSERQEAVEDLIAGSDLHVLGPNTTLNAFQPFRDDLPGPRIALITQSGHQGRPLYQAQEIGIPLSHWAPTGNEVDLESADFIRWFADRDEVGAIAAYIEGFKDGRTLMLALDRAARAEVPFSVIKVGRSDIGRSWAQSHSGHLAGSDAVMSGVFRQFGVTRVDGLDELLDVSQMFTRAAPPRGDGVCIYSISGGTGAHMADLAASYGLRLPELADETQEQLHEWIEPFLRVSNPVDSGGHPTGDWRGPKILEAILVDDEVDVLVVPIAGSFSPISEKFAEDLVAAAEGTDKPVCVIWGSPVGTEEAYRDILLPSRMPVFRSAGNCLTAVKAYFDYHAFRHRYRSAFEDVATEPSAAATKGRRLLAGGGALSEHRSKQLLSAYGVPVTRDVLCGDADEAVAAAEDLGYPVVMKVSSPALLHKSDLGLVEVGVAAVDAVRRAHARLLETATGVADPGDIEGVLVCETAGEGVETIVGVVRDDLFGPAVMFGIGGIAVEVYRDVTFRVPPFTRDEAHRMIREVTGLPLLEGARGGSPADLDALADAIMRVQTLALDLADDLDELDINPLLAGPDGVVALDALAVGRPEPGRGG